MSKITEERFEYAGVYDETEIPAVVHELYKESALQTLNKAKRMFPYKEPGNQESFNTYNEGWSDCVDYIRREIESNEWLVFKHEPYTKVIETVILNENEDSKDDFAGGLSEPEASLARLLFGNK